MSKFIKNEFLYLFLIISLFNIIHNKTIFIPFKQHPIYSQSSYDKSKFLEENISPKFVSNLRMGTPEIIIPSIFNIYDTYSVIKPNEDYKNIYSNSDNELYDPNKSSTYKNISLKDDAYIEYNRYKLIKEKIKLYTAPNLFNYEIINDFEIYLRNDNMNAFSFIDISNMKNNFIIYQLKEKKIIDKSIISIKYINEYEGYYIIGNYPHIYDKENYPIEKLMLYNIEIWGGKNFDVLASRVYISWKEENNKYKEKRINLMNGLTFNLNLNLIIASEEYFNAVKDNFFNVYINKKICDYNIIPMSGRSYMVYSCIKTEDFDITKFPSLNFIFHGFNYIFELTYENLFLEINNVYYFLVSNDYHINENWKLGKPFLKKYQFVFDGDKKLAGFYNINKTPSNNNKINNDKNTNKSNKKIIIIIFVIINIILIPIIFFVAKRRYMKKKINANELNDFFVNNKKDNEKEEINIEIGLIK